MHDRSNPLQLRNLCLSVALALSAIPMAAQAEAITLTATYSLNGGATQNGLTDPAATVSPPLPSPSGADFYLDKSEGLSNVFFHTYGFVGSPTYFGARASGEGHFDVFTQAAYTTTFTNSGSAAVPLSLTFNVDNGEVGLFGSGTGQASLLLQVLVNGNVVSKGLTSIVQTSSGVTCTETDVGVLGSYMDCGTGSANSVFGSGGPFTVDLGLVGAGQTINIEYDIVSTASGQYTAGAVDCNLNPVYGGGGGDGGGYGGEVFQTFAAAVIGVEGRCPTFNGIARSGDPFNLPISQQAPDVTLNPALNVPEPGTLALLGLSGAAALGARRRNKRDRRG